MLRNSTPYNEIERPRMGRRRPRQLLPLAVGWTAALSPTHYLFTLVYGYVAEFYC